MEMYESGKITPETAVEILRKSGKIVTLDEAKIMIELLQTIAILLVNQYLRK